MKSIMHDKESGTCYLCMMLHDDYSRKMIRQEHHAIFGTANRRLSEKYGLKVYLCMEHHEEGKEAVHKDAEIALLVKKAAQRAFEERWPELDFKNIFGKNYIDDIERGKKQQEAGEGIRFIDEGLNCMEWEGRNGMLENEYKFNRKFKDFVDEYCTEEKITVEQAFECEKVRQAFRRYTDL